MFRELRHFGSILDETKTNDSVSTVGHPKDFGFRSRGTEAVCSPYRSSDFVFLWFFRRGGQTGTPGVSLLLALFLFAPRWAYIM